MPYSGKHAPPFPDLRFEPPKVSGASSAPTSSVLHDLGKLIQIAASALNQFDSPSLGRSELPANEQMIDGARVALTRASSIVSHAIGRTAAVGELDQVSVSRCLAEIEEFFRYAWDTSVRLEIQPVAKHLYVNCDPLGLQTAVLNLALNSREAMPRGGLISIEATEVSDTSEGSAVEILVKDRGIGMSPETLGRAFDLYFTTKDKGLGGIGLASVQRFVIDAGGTISIESNLGVGTTVRLRIPGGSFDKP